MAQRILLTEENFEQLVSGQVVKIEPNIEIALADIGYDLMLNIIERLKIEMETKD